VVGSGGANTDDAFAVKLWGVPAVQSDSDTKGERAILKPEWTLAVKAGAGPVALSPDSKFLAVGATKGGEVRVYDVDETTDANEWRSVCFQKPSDAQSRHCMQLAFSHKPHSGEGMQRSCGTAHTDGQYSHCAHLLAVGWGTHVFSVFDARTSACVAHFGGEGRPSPGR
jgi:hypothetical protein